MSVFSPRVALLAVPLALMGLASCSGPTTTTASKADFYWSAALETYAAGDYNKTADHLEHLIADDNPYAARAIPFYLVLTSGMASGYMDLADRYAAGARAKKEDGLPFRRKATDYRNIASKLVLRFAQNVDRIGAVPLGSLPLAFPLPKGNPADSALFARIGKGIEISPEDAQMAEVQAVEHSVLMTACLAAGAPNDIAKTEDILGRPSASTSRATFGKAIAGMLEKGSTLYSRNQLDEPEKLAALHTRSQNVLAEAARVGSARVVALASEGAVQPQ